MDETINTTETESTTTSVPFDTKPTFAVKLTEDDKINFFKAYLADKPYQETVSLFGGKFSYSFRTLMADERADIVKQIRLDEEAGIAKNDDAYFVNVNAYAAALSLVKLNGVEFNPQTKESFQYDEKQKDLTYVKVRALAILKWPDFKLASFLDEHAKFDKKVIALMEAVNDPNF